MSGADSVSKDLGTCQCGAPATATASDGRNYCCAHCLFNPLGCRCRFGEVGVAETMQWEDEHPDDGPYFDEYYDPYEAAGESRFGLPGGGTSL